MPRGLTDHTTLCTTCDCWPLAPDDTLDVTLDVVTPPRAGLKAHTLGNPRSLDTLSITVQQATRTALSTPCVPHLERLLQPSALP